MYPGDIDLWGESYMALSGGTDARRIDRIGTALTQRGIPFAVEERHTGTQSLYIPSAAFPRIDDQFWTDIDGYRESQPDPYSFRKMVRAAKTSARRGMKRMTDRTRSRMCRRDIY
jgi:hypothetical protein